MFWSLWSFDTFSLSFNLIYLIILSIRTFYHLINLFIGSIDTAFKTLFHYITVWHKKRLTQKTNNIIYECTNCSWQLCMRWRKYYEKQKFQHWKNLEEERNHGFSVNIHIFIFRGNVPNSITSPLPLLPSECVEILFLLSFPRPPMNVNIVIIILIDG